MKIDYSKVPANHMVDGVRRWIEEGKIGIGSFLYTVVTNDLRGAVTKADSVNQHLLKEWVLFFHWEVPSDCHGSIKKAQEWISMHALARRQESSL